MSDAVETYEPTEEEVRAALERLKVQQAKRTEYQKKRNELIKSDPEAAAKMIESRKLYNKGEKAQARRKAYYEKNKEKIYASHKKYHAKQKAILAKARELGLLDNGDKAPQQKAQVA
jgi:hypothetical protein